jgi:hypothetical protein
MKRTLLFFAFVYIWAAAFSQGYTIAGDIKGLKNKKLLLIKIVDGNFLGEEVSVTDGKFFFSGTADEPFFAQLLRIKNGTKTETEGKLTELIIENSNITLSGKSPKYDDVKISGSVADSVLKIYLAEDHLLDNKWDKLKARLKLISKTQKRERDSLIKVMNFVLLNEKIPLLKHYVKENSNSIVGALIPNFCTMTKLLKKEDYREMYDMLTPEIQKTALAKSILSKATNKM